MPVTSATGILSIFTQGSEGSGNFFDVNFGSSSEPLDYTARKAITTIKAAETGGSAGGNTGGEVIEQIVVDSEDLASSQIRKTTIVVPESAIDAAILDQLWDLGIYPRSNTDEEKIGISDSFAFFIQASTEPTTGDFLYSNGAQSSAEIVTGVVQAPIRPAQTIRLPKGAFLKSGCCRC